MGNNGQIPLKTGHVGTYPTLPAAVAAADQVAGERIILLPVAPSGRMVLRFWKESRVYQGFCGPDAYAEALTQPHVAIHADEKGAGFLVFQADVSLSS